MSVSKLNRNSENLFLFSFRKYQDKTRKQLVCSRPSQLIEIDINQCQSLIAIA